MNKQSTATLSWYRPLQSIFGLAAIVFTLVGLVGPTRVLAEPAISAISASQITATTAVISWTTDVAGDTYVSYIGEDDEEALFASSDVMVTSHTITLTSLKPATTYSFTVNSADAQGDNAAMNGVDFTTLALGSPAPAPTPAPNPTPTPAPAPGGGLQYPGGEQPSPAGGLQYEASPVTTPLYPTGTLAKEGNAIYFIMGRDQVKIPFTSMAVFSGLGYKLQNIKTVDISAFRIAATYILDNPSQQHPWGSVLDNNGTLYYSIPEGMIGIPSMDVFTNNGFETWMIQSMNAADRTILNSTPSLPVLDVHDNRLM